MRRADYLTLGAIIAAERTSARDAEHASRMNGALGGTDSRDSGRLDAAERIAREFAKRAHLGGLTQWDFLRACGIAA